MKYLLLIFCLYLTGQSFSQTEGDTLLFQLRYVKGSQYVFKTVAGTTHTGYVIKETADSVTIENRSINEKMDIFKRDIVGAKLVQQRKTYQQQDEFGENNHAGNYLFSSSAFEFEEGTISTNNHWILLQNIDYALNENWAFTSNAIAFYPLSVGLKCSYAVGEVTHLGANVFGMGNAFSGNGNQALLWGYGALAKYTRGTTNKNITVSAGMLGINSQLISSTVSSPFINLAFLSFGYCNRFNQNLAFVTEGWYMPASQIVIGGLGLKWVKNENYCWSFGCYSFIDSYDNTFKLNLKSVPIPYIGIGRRFN